MGKAAIATIGGVFGTAASASTGAVSASRSRTDTVSTAAATGNSGDRAVGTQSGVRLTVNLTALSGTSPTIAFALFDSADNTTFAAVPGATIAALSSTGTAQLSVSLPVRRYVGIGTTVTGTTPSATFTWTIDDGLVTFTPHQNPDHSAVKDTRT